MAVYGLLEAFTGLCFGGLRRWEPFRLISTLSGERSDLARILHLWGPFGLGNTYRGFCELGGQKCVLRIYRGLLTFAPSGDKARCVNGNRQGIT